MSQGAQWSVPGHPVLAAVSDASASLASVVEVPLWSLDDLGFAHALGAAYRLIGQGQELLVRLVGAAGAGGVPARAGASGATAWVRHQLNMTPRAAKQLTATAQAIRDGMAATGAALADGTIGYEQAAVITRAVTQLPPDVDPDVPARAEADLIGKAAIYDPQQLARLGEHILSVVAPEVGEARDAAALARQEERDRAARDLSASSDRRGNLFLRGRLDPESAQIVQAALDPFTAPVPGPDGAKDLRSTGARRADALVEVCRRVLAHSDGPTTGGEATQVVVHVPLSTLYDGLGQAAYQDGTRISPGLARKLACGADLVPAVLGTDSAVLDVGRTQRLFTGARRRAIVLRDKGCTFPGCDRPASWCIVHHVKPWWLGGPTDQNNGVLLCHQHHHVLHQGDWTIVFAVDGHPEFIPPSWVDPDQRPHRNRRHE